MMRTFIGSEASRRVAREQLLGLDRRMPNKFVKREHDEWGGKMQRVDESWMRRV